MNSDLEELNSELANLNSWILNLRKTANIEEINKAVYYGNLVTYQYIGVNPNLTATHIRHIFHRFLEADQSPPITICHPSCSSDVLYGWALLTENESTLQVISQHPNANEETQVIVALKLGCGL